MVLRTIATEREEKREFYCILERMMKMQEQIPVSFRNVEDVNKFVNIISKYDTDFDLYCGTYCVDAKSLLGIMTMDLRNVMFIKGNCDQAEKRVLEHELRSCALA